MTEANTSSVTVSGHGTNRVTSASTGMTGTYAVSSGATAVFAADSGFANGTVSVANGARLVAAGNAGKAGNLTIADGALLEFRLNGETSTSLAATSVTAASGDKATICFTPGSSKLVGQSYTLITGANLADTSAFALSDDDRGTLSVDGSGNLVYTAPTYFLIKVK